MMAHSFIIAAATWRFVMGDCLTNKVDDHLLLVQRHASQAKTTKQADSFDPAGKGPDIVLSSGDMSATSTAEKNWDTVTTVVGYTSGTHEWDVHIDALLDHDKNYWEMIIGVANGLGSLRTALPANDFGYGWIQENGQITNGNGASVPYAGENNKYGLGDTVTVVLDIDSGTLAFKKNGVLIGTSHTGLPSGKTWRLGVSIHDKEDVVTLVPRAVVPFGKWTITRTASVQGEELIEVAEFCGLGTDTFSTVATFDSWYCQNKQNPPAKGWILVDQNGDKKGRDWFCDNEHNPNLESSDFVADAACTGSCGQGDGAPKCAASSAYAK